MTQGCFIYGVIEIGGIEHETEVLLSHKAYLEDAKKLFKVVSRVDEIKDFDKAHLIRRYCHTNYRYIIGTRKDDGYLWSLVFSSTITYLWMTKAFTGGYRSGGRVTFNHEGEATTYGYSYVLDSAPQRDDAGILGDFFKEKLGRKAWIDQKD